METTNWVPLFPEQASTFAPYVDYLYFYLVFVSIAFTIPIVVAIFIFAMKYRAKERYATPEQIHGSMVLETTWSIIPFIVSMTIFLGGAVLYFHQYTPPENAMSVYVVGKQWMWKIQHETGQREINELHVPVDSDIKLIMTTEDVIHDFGLPEFRTKADIVPGRYTYLWFKATKPGKYHLFCQEYCGLNHSGMGGWVYVMAKDDFQKWLSGNASGQTPVEMGKDLFENKLGCASCHAGGPQQRGAKLEGLYMSTVHLTGGGTVVADDNYIRNSILNPASQIVEGYQPIMPTFQGQVTEEQLNGLIAYVKSLTPGASTSGSSAAPAPAANTAGTTAAKSMAGNKADRGKKNAAGSNPNTPSNSNR
ncbi:MAG: cytochrome c oxidase subunit II [Acidobacteria bacterium]|nr:cytochrome c oxidase subunit II [Acidobacteriota bacterium]